MDKEKSSNINFNLIYRIFITICIVAVVANVSIYVAQKYFNTDIVSIVKNANNTRDLWRLKSHEKTNKLRTYRYPVQNFTDKLKMIGLKEDIIKKMSDSLESVVDINALPFNTSFYIEGNFDNRGKIITLKSIYIEDKGIKYVLSINNNLEIISEKVVSDDYTETKVFTYDMNKTLKKQMEEIGIDSDTASKLQNSIGEVSDIKKLSNNITFYFDIVIDTQTNQNKRVDRVFFKDTLNNLIYEIIKNENNEYISHKYTPIEYVESKNDDANINAQDKNGVTTLMRASSNINDVVYIQELLKKGADANIKDKNGWTALHYASRNNSNPEIIELLINNGADVNHQDTGGSTALDVAAAFSKDVKVLKKLIDKGADVNILNNGHQSVLFAAIGSSFDNLNKVQLLLKHNANPNVVGYNGASPLVLALVNNKSGEIIAELIGAGADVNKRDYSGRTPLIDYIYFSQDACEEEIVSMLVANGADVNARDDEGNTALMQSVLNQDEKCLNTLIDYGADVNITNNKGMPALIYALDNESIAQKLISNGANVNAKLLGGKTSVILYALQECKNENIVRLLLENSANLDDRDVTELTTYQAAKKNENINAFEVLKEFMHTDEYQFIVKSVNLGNDSQYYYLYKGTNKSKEHIDEITKEILGLIPNETMIHLYDDETALKIGFIQWVHLFGWQGLPEQAVMKEGCDPKLRGMGCNAHVIGYWTSEPSTKDAIEYCKNYELEHLLLSAISDGKEIQTIYNNYELNGRYIANEKYGISKRCNPTELAERAYSLAKQVDENRRKFEHSSALWKRCEDLISQKIRFNEGLDFKKSNVYPITDQLYKFSINVNIKPADGNYDETEKFMCIYNANQKNFVKVSVDTSN